MTDSEKIIRNLRHPCNRVFARETNYVYATYLDYVLEAVKKPSWQKRNALAANVCRLAARGRVDKKRFYLYTFDQIEAALDLHKNLSHDYFNPKAE